MMLSERFLEAHPWKLEEYRRESETGKFFPTGVVDHYSSFKLASSTADARRGPLVEWRLIGDGVLEPN